MYTQLT